MTAGDAARPYVTAAEAEWPILGRVVIDPDHTYATDDADARCTLTPADGVVHISVRSDFPSAAGDPWWRERELANTIRHELAHGIKARIKWLDPARPIDNEYWDDCRSFPGTYAAAAAECMTPTYQWIADPNESWAECMGAAIAGAWTKPEKTLDRGLPITAMYARAWLASAVARYNAPRRIAMRTMYDSTNAGSIPLGVEMVAGYVDGAYRWIDADWARFPDAIKVRIACFASTNDGQVLDVESGCAAPHEAPGWVTRARARGVDPTVYMSASAWSAVRAAFVDAGVAEPHYWVAHYDNVIVIPPGAVAKQYANEPLAGGHFDLSVVADHWPGIDTEGGVLDMDEQRLRAIIREEVHGVVWGPGDNPATPAPEVTGVGLTLTHVARRVIRSVWAKLLNRPDLIRDPGRAYPDDDVPITPNG